MTAPEAAALPAIALAGPTASGKTAGALALAAVLARRGMPVEIISVQQSLKDAGRLDEVGGLAYLSSLQDVVPSAANVSYYVEILKEKWLARRLVRICSDTAARIYEGGEGNAPFDGDYGVEQFITTQQAGPFAAMCDVYAPVYRQITMGAFGAENTAELLETAYGDVVDSFQHYLANDNDGRPFVLMGHSQGSGMITRLIQEEIDDDAELREQMISALVIGSAVGAPEGEDVGGAGQGVVGAGEKQDRDALRDLLDGPDRRDRLEVGEDHRRGDPKARVGRPIEPPG